MYCSSCGGSVVRGLSYCNHCGAKMPGARHSNDAEQTDSFSESLVWAMVTVFIIGFGCLIGMMAVMKGALELPNNMILVVVLLSFLLMFVIEGVFIWHLLGRRKRSSSRETNNAAELTHKEQTPQELYAPPAAATTARALTDQPIPSVVEHTTRALELVEREKNPK